MNWTSFFHIDSLNGFVAIAVLGFSLIVILYSVRFMKGKPNLFRYYLWTVLAAIGSVGVCFANNLIVLLGLWGFLGLALYILINTGGEGANEVAKKTFVIVGGTDALMLLGIAIIYFLSGTSTMTAINLQMNSGLTITAYLCVAVACFAKAGLMPFHSWIPECAQKAPLPVVAFLPASLDKLLGIYLLARLSLNLFVMNEAMNILLMVMGAFTIIVAVMMALAQHDMKKLLGFHAVSQVGYMVLGIGTGNPIGIAGGIFHMLNHAIYKSCLFFTSGNVEHRLKTTELDELGGLAKLMPITYICTIIASLSISGIPPFNGFVSKWMIYQGIVTDLRVHSMALKVTSVICLFAAMFGSSLTLASFMKLIHATYLGQEAKSNAGVRTREVSWQMWLPCVILAVLCAVLGVFAIQLPLKYFILPAIGCPAVFIGTWQAVLATGLVVIALILGLLAMRLSLIKPKVRQGATFIGGEELDLVTYRMTGTEFYKTITDLSALKRFYKAIEGGALDIYEQGKDLVFFLAKPLHKLHNGVLSSYLVWCLLGIMAMLLWGIVK
ncbi:MAG: hypothetical protein KJ880_03905 [Candidatus Omnitrophica bacterium]|nr:hypothetical protein [Candidatus Omnitrophota bacterium]